MTKIRLLLAGALAALALGVAGATAATTTNLRVLSIGGDSFRNYDFTTTTVSSYRVDWPVDLLFFNNAEIDKVKARLYWRYPWDGDPMYANVNDGYGFVWDRDLGRKTILCPAADTATHFRIYADGDDRLYNVYWGFYNLATAHLDANECWWGRWHGKSEVAEGKVASDARAVFGTVWEDCCWFWNPEPYRVEGNHIWQNDGYTTYVRVP